MNEISNETLKQLIKLVEKRIKSINANIASNTQKLLRVNEYDELVKTIKDDNSCFGNPAFISKLDNLLSGIIIDNTSALESLLEKLNYLDVISNSIIEGYLKEYTEEELNVINEVIELILYFKSVSSEQKSEQRSNVTKSNEELVKCEAIYDKLRNGFEGLVHFDEDLPYILNLISNEDPSFKKDVLVLIQHLSKAIHENLIRQFGEDGVTVEIDEIDVDEVNSEEIDEDLIRGVFAKYGFNYDFFTKDHREVLSRISLVRIESILEVLHTYDEYEFVYSYMNSRREKDLFFIIRYASKEALEYFIVDAKNRGVDVKDIFGVTGVYKKVSKVLENSGGSGPGGDSEHLSGCYEYYKKNAEYLERLTLEYLLEHPHEKADFYKTTLLTTPNVLGLPPGLLENNIKLAEQYGIKVYHKTLMGEASLRCATMYLSRKFEEECDLLIEHDMYDYVKNYSSVLAHHEQILKMIYVQRNGELEYMSNGKLKDLRYKAPSYLDYYAIVNGNNLERIIEQVPGEIIEFVENPENRKLLTGMENDSVMNAMDSGKIVRCKDEYTYDISGIFVSRRKFKRIWYLIKMSGHVEKGDLSNLLLYALTYKSLYTDEQLAVLEEFANGFNFGGKTLWNV